MSTPPFPDFSSPFINGVHEAASHHVRKGLLDIIRDSFTAGQIRSGNYYFSRIRTMIKQHYPGLPLRDQNAIHYEFAKVLDMQDALKAAQGTLEKYTLARRYKRISKKTFIIVETASNRADTNDIISNVMGQPSEASGGSGRPPQPPPTGTTSTITNPFSDRHAASALSDIDVSNVNQMEMSTFVSKPTGEAAVIIDLQNRDGSTQEVVATFPLEAMLGHRANEDEGDDRATLASSVVFGHSGTGGDVGQ